MPKYRWNDLTNSGRAAIENISGSGSGGGQIKGLYDPTSAYKAGDVVAHNGHFQMCTTDIAAGSTPSAQFIGGRVQELENTQQSWGVQLPGAAQAGDLLVVVLAGENIYQPAPSSSTQIIPNQKLGTYLCINGFTHVLGDAEISSGTYPLANTGAGRNGLAAFVVRHATASSAAAIANSLQLPTPNAQSGDMALTAAFEYSDSNTLLSHPDIPDLLVAHSPSSSFFMVAAGELPEVSADGPLASNPYVDAETKLDAVSVALIFTGVPFPYSNFQQLI